jgi:hypothetical protein
LMLLPITPHTTLKRDVEMLAAFAELVARNASKATQGRLRAVGFTDVQISDIAPARRLRRRAREFGHQV